MKKKIKKIYTFADTIRQIIQNQNMKDIKRIVLTGGPCAGKTTALVRVIEHFSGLGYKVFTIPELTHHVHASGHELPD